MTQIDKNIALNLKRIRRSKNLSLDMLSERTGVSKSMLGQIERGESNPTVSTIGKIVEGLKVPFEQLIYMDNQVIQLPSPTTAPVCKESKGEYSIHTLLPYDSHRKMEIYQGYIEKEATMDVISFGEDSWECLTVLKGEVDLIIEEEVFHIQENASMYFACDREHSYKNRSKEEAIINMVITK